ncbi:hypothetical protein PPL_09182 [Heterostelium album PN500]|uniref:Uncharacterized protein n=1 Tax=Heterostelium pallidum (strain ATCC 26659 / Pp 5 / PN500) TaxID=670386 RepID=D3BKV0_HETP5|nr:hypothetical protein PPL_09182 [Heterostelium album PN500]EFA78530.1 hypothetical protein PPL_09182 [Heterostelium album PN500]|eukprot:XP_020430654.1 hypothetical protein PPL_09182 [Heterostelium album PN500]
MSTRWKVDLATVSKQFHRICSTIMSNYPIKSLKIFNEMTHIGSQYCLFKNPPLHLVDDQIVFIPNYLLTACIENLQSLTQTFSVIASPNYTIHLLNAKNLRHITFRGRLQMNEYYPDNNTMESIVFKVKGGLHQHQVCVSILNQFKQCNPNIDVKISLGDLAPEPTNGNLTVIPWSASDLSLVTDLKLNLYASKEQPGLQNIRQLSKLNKIVLKFDGFEKDRDLIALQPEIQQLLNQGTVRTVSFHMELGDSTASGNQNHSATIQSTGNINSLSHLNSKLEQLFDLIRDHNDTVHCLKLKVVLNNYKDLHLLKDNIHCKSRIF